MHKPVQKPLIFLVFKTLTIAFLIAGCSSLKKTLTQRMGHVSFQNSLHGLVVVDANTNKEVYAVNGDIYFTPASNTKIATFYTGLQLLPQNIPSLRYVVANDTVFFEGSGDPTWLHPFFKDSTALHWLQKQGNLALFTKNHQEDRYGPGWAWEDYDTYFSPEKSTLPLYGNVVTVFYNNGLEVSPTHFKNRIALKDTTIHREEFRNRFYLSPTEKDTLEVPFITSDTLTKRLLEAALGKKVTLSDRFPEGKKQVIYGVSTDSIYKQMLFASDNFLAEQLLLTASGMVSDTLSTQKAIDYMLDNDLKNLAQQPRWVDGSGLSRYNLFTPRSLVHILQKLHNQIPEKRLFAIFPMWGPDNTVEQWQDPTTEPFLFAKSGSMGNNYNLSGYIKTKSGKLLIFSFMNNHFRVPSQVIREQMYTTLKHLYEHY